MLSKKTARRAVIMGTISVSLGVIGLTHSFAPFLLGEGLWRAVIDAGLTALGVVCMNSGLSVLAD